MPAQTDQLIPEIYYEFTEDDPDMADYIPQHAVGVELETLLQWLYRAQNWFITGNVYLLHQNYPRIAPDVFLVKTKLTDEEKAALNQSWDMRQSGRPAPDIVIEIASGETYLKDLGEKVERYRLMGVKEYFAYDPSMPKPVWAEKTVRLKGWKYVNGVFHAPASHPKNPGWLWSEVLERWLVPAGEKLHLYNDKEEREEPSQEVAQKAVARIQELDAIQKTQQLQLENERTKRQAAELRAQKEQSERQAAERQVAEKDALIEALRRKMREQGLNPDDII
jgi:Uma2 family endonuclease